MRNALAADEDVSEISETEPTVVWESGEEGDSQGDLRLVEGSMKQRPRIPMATSISSTPVLN